MAQMASVAEERPGPGVDAGQWSVPWSHSVEKAGMGREIADLVTSAGLTIVEIDACSDEGAPKLLGADTRGDAAA